MGASFLLAVNVALGIAIMVSFLGFGLFDRSHKASLWWFFTCLTGVISGLIEYSLPPSESTQVQRFAIYTMFAISLCCLSTGLAIRFARRIPVAPIVTGLLLSVAGYLCVAEMPRDSMIRSFVYQGSYSCLALIGVYYILKGMERTALDRLLLAVVIFNALHFLLRPPMQVLLGGNGATAQQYLGTDYAMASQTLMAIATILTAFALGMRTLADILANIQRRSEIDALSGALSRDGFRREVARILDVTPRHATPMALVLADLDHFKEVNDTYGHQVGDAVIAAFGALLADCRGPNDIVGRIGGEEFCVVLPRCDEQAARLLAEQLRSSFASLDMSGGLHARGCTASFGVTEFNAGENFDAVFSRADRALYEAKRAGRNCVRIARGEDIAITCLSKSPTGFRSSRATGA